MYLAKTIECFSVNPKQIGEREGKGKKEAYGKEKDRQENIRRCYDQSSFEFQDVSYNYVRY